MFNPHIKFGMSTITCNEEMKGNAKRKNQSRTETEGRLLPGRSGPCDLDLGYGSRSYRCASLIEYYLYTKFDKDKDRINLRK